MSKNKINTLCDLLNPNIPGIWECSLYPALCSLPIEILLFILEFSKRKKTTNIIFVPAPFRFLYTLLPLDKMLNIWWTFFKDLAQLSSDFWFFNVYGSSRNFLNRPGRVVQLTPPSRYHIRSKRRPIVEDIKDRVACEKLWQRKNNQSFPEKFNFFDICFFQIH